MTSPDDDPLEDMLLRLHVRGLLSSYELRGETVRFQHCGVRLDLPREKAWPYVLGLIQGCRRANEYGAATPLPSVEADALKRTKEET